MAAVAPLDIMDLSGSKQELIDVDENNEYVDNDENAPEDTRETRKKKIPVVRQKLNEVIHFYMTNR
jgi:hypothetical protein